MDCLEHFVGSYDRIGLINLKTFLTDLKNELTDLKNELNDLISSEVGVDNVGDLLYQIVTSPIIVGAAEETM